MNEDLIKKWQNDMAELIKPLLNPVYPSSNFVSDRWEKVTKNTLPRSFFYLIDIKNRAVLRTFGFSNLGYSENKIFGFDEIVGMIPEFQRALAIYQILAIYKTMYLYKDEIRKGEGFYYSAQRAIVDKNGEIWNTIQTTEPFQFDKNNRIVIYLSWVHIIGKHTDQGMFGELFYKEPGVYKGLLEEMNEDLNQEKSKILAELKLKYQQTEILKFLSLGLKTKEISSKMKLSDSGVRHHFRIIKKKLEILFHPKKFKDTSAAVIFLNRQQFFTY